MLAITVLQSLITICIPLTYKGLIDQAFPKRDFNLFMICVSGMLILFFTNSLLNILKDYLLAKIVENLSFSLRRGLNDKLSRLPYKFFDDHKLSDILSRYNKEIDTIKQNCGYMTVSIFSNAVTTVFACSMILFLIGSCSPFPCSSSHYTSWSTDALEKSKRICGKNDEKQRAIDESNGGDV